MQIESLAEVLKDLGRNSLRDSGEVERDKVKGKVKGIFESKQRESEGALHFFKEHFA